MDIKKNEILYCNLYFIYKKHHYKLLKVVYKHTDGFFYKKDILGNLKIREPVKITKIDIICKLGFGLT